MEEDDIVVEIRGGTQPPVWLLHPIGGNVLYAHAFAATPEFGLRAAAPAKKRPTNRRALFAIQARGLNGRSAPFTSIVEASKFYLSILRSRQPHGPYYLGGPSFGGNVAYEMACGLMSQGERVELLALFDAFGPNYPRLAPLLERARIGLSRLARWGRAPTPRVDPEEQRKRHKALYDLARIPTGQSEAIRTLQRVSLAHQHALTTYHPSTFAGQVHLFRAEPPDWQGLVFDSPFNGWDSVVRGGVHVTPVPGSHQFILDPPSVHHLVSALDALLHPEVEARGLACEPEVEAH